MMNPTAISITSEEESGLWEYYSDDFESVRMRVEQGELIHHNSLVIEIRLRENSEVSKILLEEY